MVAHLGSQILKRRLILTSISGRSQKTIANDETKSRSPDIQHSSYIAWTILSLIRAPDCKNF